MENSNNSAQNKFHNNENNNFPQNNRVQNENENEENEIIIELEIYKNKELKDINILCDKNQLIEDNKNNIHYYPENTLPKEFNYFNNNNTKLYHNNNEIEFKYKIKFNQKGIYKFIIKSNVMQNYCLYFQCFITVLILLILIL